MKQHLPFFLIAFAVAAVAIYWPARWVQTHSTDHSAPSEIGGLLLREAELVEHFCLGRYAPMPGRSGIPAEWEKALGSRIRLRDNVGEVVSEAPELASRADEIRNLPPGASLYVATSGDATAHVLVRRPPSAPNQFLVISKSDVAEGENLRKSPVSPFLVALLSALGAALILTAVRATLNPRTSRA
jgi:hypothetical protein